MTEKKLLILIWNIIHICIKLSYCPRVIPEIPQPMKLNSLGLLRTLS